MAIAYTCAEIPFIFLNQCGLFGEMMSMDPDLYRKGLYDGYGKYLLNVLVSNEHIKYNTESSGLMDRFLYGGKTKDQGFYEGLVSQVNKHYILNTIGDSFENPDLFFIYNQLNPSFHTHEYGLFIQKWV